MLDYKPSAIARSLVTRRNNKIGVIVLEITNPYQTQVVRGIEDYKTINNLKYNIILMDMKNNEDNGDKYIDELLENRVEGIITTSEHYSEACIKYLKKINIPIVFIGRFVNIRNIKIDYVTVDNFKGSFEMTRYLTKLGHKKIAYITGPITSSVSKLRLSGYKKALEESHIENLKPDIIESEDFTYEFGLKAAKQIFTRKERPTAIFCANDYSAFGVIDYCYGNNISIPGDVSIAGFDDVYFSSFDFVGLTTVKQPIKKLVEMAAEILFKKINGIEKDYCNIVLDPEIVVRKTTRAIA